MRMWRLCFCLIMLAGWPALGQGARYDGDGFDYGYRRQAASHGHRKMPRRVTDPYRLGPAPTGFWYRCDASSGYYPYVLTCPIPWRMVPATPQR